MGAVIMIRDDIKQAQIAAMKAGDKEKLAAVRLILAKLKDRDIELRVASSVPDDDVVVDRDAHRLGGGDDLAGHGDIGLGGGWIARGVIVAEDDGRGRHLQRPPHDLARIDGRVIDGALRDLGNRAEVYLDQLNAELTA